MDRGEREQSPAELADPGRTHRGPLNVHVELANLSTLAKITSCFGAGEVSYISHN